MSEIAPIALKPEQRRAVNAAEFPKSRAFARTTQVLKSPRGVQILVIMTDMAALLASFSIFYVVRVNSVLFSDLTGYPFWLFLQTNIMVLAFWMFLFWFCGIYISIHNRALFDEYYSVLKVVLFGFLIIFTAVYIANSSTPSGFGSNRFVSALIYFLLVASFLAVGRSLVRKIVRRLRRHGFGLRRTIIVGDSPRSRQLLEMFRSQPDLGFSVVGTVSIGTVDLYAGGGACSSSHHEVRQSPGVKHGPDPDDFSASLLGRVEEIDRIIASRDIEVTVLGMEHERDLVLKLMTETAVADTTIKIIPDLYDIVSGQARAQHLYGMPLIEVNPQIMPAWEQHLKRILDIMFSALVLIAGFPLWLLIGIVIKLEDFGPIFYGQERVGLAGRTFRIHKFRSMRVDAEVGGIAWTHVNDPRVTKFGRIIRKLHLDEVPQFWNVLVGEMSLVGPRPERPYFVDMYTKMLQSFSRRLRVKPGLTGWNQVQMGEVSDSLEFVQERLRHDFFYIENISLRLDIEILLRTVIRIMQRKGQA